MADPPEAQGLAHYLGEYRFVSLKVVKEQRLSRAGLKL